MNVTLRCLMKSLEQYINAVIATKINIETCNQQLPFFLQDRYELFDMVLFDQKCIILKNNAADLSPTSIKKHTDILERKLGIPAVYVCESLSSYERDKLVQHQVSFIVPNNQLFLPFLGVYFREKFLSNKKKDIDELSMAATVVLVCMLHSDHFELKDLVNETGYTKMTISRSADELENFGIIKSEHVGRKRLLSLVNCKRTTWENFLGVMKSPVREKLFLQAKAIDLSQYPKSGYDALSLLSDLNEPDIPIFAIEWHEWKKLQQIKPVNHGDICIEIWRINPKLFSINGVVNPYFLGISLKDDLDDRVVACVNMSLNKEGIFNENN